MIDWYKVFIKRGQIMIKSIFENRFFKDQAIFFNEMILNYNVTIIIPLVILYIKVLD